jgi:hypothetical protein
MDHWYLVDFARSRHANPARMPVSPSDGWYKTVLAPSILQIRHVILTQCRQYGIETRSG